MRIQRTLTLLAGTAGTALTAAALMAGPAVGGPGQPPGRVADDRSPGREHGDEPVAVISPGQLRPGEQRGADGQRHQHRTSGRRRRAKREGHHLRRVNRNLHFTFVFVVGRCSPTALAAGPRHPRSPPSTRETGATSVLLGAGDPRRQQGQTTAVPGLSAPTAGFGQEEHRGPDRHGPANGGGYRSDRDGLRSHAGTENVLCTADLPAGASTATCHMSDIALLPGTSRRPP